MPALKTKAQVAELMRRALLGGSPSLPKSFLPPASAHPSV